MTQLAQRRQKTEQPGEGEGSFNRSYLGALWASLRAHPGVTIPGTFLFLIILMAILAPLLPLFDPTKITLSQRLLPPNGTHWFGTDALGRDVFSQVVFGARLSLASGASAVLLAVAIGAPIGLMAAYYGKWVDMALMRFSDIFLAYPPLLLPIAITAALGPGLFNVMLAIGISWFPWYARIMRAAALSVREELYVKAAKVAGVGDFTIMRRHILPNALTPLIVQLSLDFGYTILAAASLSFIGLGAQPPAIEWGLMVSQSRALVLDYWWTPVFPGLAILITVLTINILGDGLRAILDPNRRQVS